MPIRTDLNVSPYYDDYDTEKDFYRILFRPGVAVQARELNQLQTILQNQIERFGDNILKRGTIVDGCNFSFYPVVPFVRLQDVTAENRTFDIYSFKGLNVKNSSNLVAQIIEVAPGFESQGEDTNTLYLNYINFSADGQTKTFDSGSVLTVYNYDNRLYSVKVNEDSENFTDADSVVIYSAVEVQNTTGGTTLEGTFGVGDFIVQDTTGARAEIVAVDTSSNAYAVVLKIKPLTSDLAVQNTTAWASLTTGQNIDVYDDLEASPIGSANVVGLVGSGATGLLSTTATGRVSAVEILDNGSGYYVPPYVTISTQTASTEDIDALSLTAKNYLANVIVVTTSTPAPTGLAYGFYVSPGIIYQKGYFSRVEEQFKIIEKYSNVPHRKSVGFVTFEEIISSTVDDTLLDNSTGTFNQNAPGANRLKLTPQLEVYDTDLAEEDEDFFSLVDFSEGRPYRQHRTTAYNKIADEMARRTKEESGDYALDPFLVTTRSPLYQNAESQSFTVLIDPGHAYIDGYRVQTLTNYAVNIDKGIETSTRADVSFDITYGNYLRVFEYGGTLDFKAGTQIRLYSTAKSYITNGGGSLTAPSNQVGTARVRSIVYENGEIGTPSATYRIYVFDIQMNAGKGVYDVQSIAYVDGSTVEAVADVDAPVINLAIGQTWSENFSPVADSKDNSLIIGADKLESVSEISSIKYSYRTYTSDTISTTGTISIEPDTSSYFKYIGSLSDAEKKELIVVPQTDAVPSTAVISTGTLQSISRSGNLITFEANNTVSLPSLFSEGDWVYADDGSDTLWARVQSIQGQNVYAYGPDVSALTLGSTKLTVGFPANIPIDLSTLKGRSASIDINGHLIIDVDITLPTNIDVDVTYNLITDNISHVDKDAYRNRFVKIRANTHIETTTGPWCLGIPDIFRLRAVYKSDNIATVNSNSTDVTKHFYIDHNQTENYYDLGFLYLKPDSTLTIGTNDALLVEFDYFHHNGQGVKTFNSYGVDDSKTLDELTTDCNLLEIPEVFGARGDYYDLRDALDFRPTVEPTANDITDEASVNITINPEYYGQSNSTPESDKFNTVDKMFPTPESDIIFDYTYYLPRTDTVVLKATGEFNVLKNERRLVGYNGEIVLSTIDVPPYPSLPERYSIELARITDTKMANDRYTRLRLDKYQIETQLIDEQPRGYTMDEIGKLERRIEALEYYARLSETEDIFKDRPIPSDVDATLDRYKFGFFVDNFVGPEYADLENPEYNASIYEFRLYPKKTDINIYYQFSEVSEPYLGGTDVTYPYEDYCVIGQKFATDGRNDPPPEPEKQKWCLKCVNIYNENTRHNKKPSSINDIRYDEHVFNFADNNDANNAVASLYFDIFTGNDRIEVWQSTTTVFSGAPFITTDNAIVLTASDRVTLSNEKVFATSTWRRGDWTLLNRPNLTKHAAVGLNTTGYLGLLNVSQFWTKGAGKIVFNYDKSKGTYFKVRVVRGSPHYSFRFCFPSNCEEAKPKIKITKPPQCVEPPIIVCRPPPPSDCVCGILSKDDKDKIVKTVIEYFEEKDVKKKAKNKKAKKV